MHTRKFDYYSMDHTWGGNPTSTSIRACNSAYVKAMGDKPVLFGEQREQRLCTIPSPIFHTASDGRDPGTRLRFHLITIASCTHTSIQPLGACISTITLLKPSNHLVSNYHDCCRPFAAAALALDPVLPLSCV